MALNLPYSPISPCHAIALYVLTHYWRNPVKCNTCKALFILLMYSPTCMNIIDKYIHNISIYCKLFEMEKFHRFRGSIGKCESFPVKHFLLYSFKNGGSRSRVFFNRIVVIYEGPWNNAAFPQLLIHGSNAPDKINIIIQPFPNDVKPMIYTQVLTGGYFKLVHYCTFKSFLVVRLGVSRVYRELFMHISTFSFKNQWSWQIAKIFQQIGTSLSIHETFLPWTICNIWYVKHSYSQK